MIECSSPFSPAACSLSSARCSCVRFSARAGRPGLLCSSEGERGRSGSGVEEFASAE